MTATCACGQASITVNALPTMRDGKRETWLSLPSHWTCYAE